MILPRCLFSRTNRFYARVWSNFSGWEFPNAVSRSVVFSHLSEGMCCTQKLQPSATPQLVALPQDDDDSLLSCIPDAGIDDLEAPWVELPESATSPCALAADFYQTLPEDMDVFAKEDWPGDGVWGFNGADTSPDEREFDVQSDESLISASFPFASITTRSPQPCSFTLYHHSNVDLHQLDLAASGLRYNASQLACLGDSENSALFENLTHSPSHAPQDHHYSEKYEQLMRESGTSCQVGSESFETLDSSSEREEVEDLDSMLFDLDEDIDAPRQTLDTADLTVFDDW